MPEGLEKVILTALEKNPVRRYQTCAALAEGLAAVYDTDATREGPGPVGPPPPKPPRDKPAIRVILADDHTILRKTLVSFLEEKDDFVVVAEAGDGDGALKETLALLPDVLLLDLNMPNKGGLEILPTVRQEAPNVKVLILTGREEDWYIMRALRAGAHGYLLKSAAEDELLDGIVKVTEGHLVLGQGVAEKIVTGLLTGRSESEMKLDDAERQVLLYVAGGYENDDIAKHLQIPITKVIETLAQTINKLGARDRNSAALKALKQGYIMLDDLHKLA
jgi:DNA-binding NarL/FixJ family response regulator